MKNLLIAFALLGVLFLSGCSSSYDDCKQDCYWDKYECSLLTVECKDGLKPTEVNNLCYEECKFGNEPLKVLPEEPKETVIIEINTREIDVYCHSYLNYEPNERIDFNGTLYVWDEGTGQDYMESGSRMIIYPFLNVFLRLDYPENIISDETRCHMNSVDYNITISGKTVSDSIRVNVEDCENYHNCGVIERIIDKMRLN